MGSEAAVVPCEGAEAMAQRLSRASSAWSRCEVGFEALLSCGSCLDRVIVDAGGVRSCQAGANPGLELSGWL